MEFSGGMDHIFGGVKETHIDLAAPPERSLTVLDVMLHCRDKLLQVSSFSSRVPTKTWSTLRTLWFARHSLRQGDNTQRRALCESVLLSAPSFVLRSRSNSPTWASRSRCRVPVVTHGGCRRGQSSS